MILRASGCFPTTILLIDKRRGVYITAPSNRKLLISSFATMHSSMLVIRVYFLILYAFCHNETVCLHFLFVLEKTKKTSACRVAFA